MLIDCPECGRRVSDRAKSCPDCGYPVAEEVAAREAAERAAAILKSRRKSDREVDCVACEARGFVQAEGSFSWCVVCEHTGRVALCQADDGYYAVADRLVDQFVAGKVNAGEAGVSFLGPQAPAPHRYPQVGMRVKEDAPPDES